MNLLAAATPPAQLPPGYQNQAYQNQQYQNTTVQPDRPVAKIPTSVYVLNYSYFACKVAIIIFLVVLVYKFVRAFEKIANSLEKGLVIRKDDTTT